MMQPKIFLIITFIFSTCFASMFAQQESGFTAVTNTQAIKDQIRNASTRVSSIQSDFIQKKHLTMMDEVLTSEGRFLFKKENQVRWEYFAPINYIILIKNQNFTIVNEGKVSKFDIEGNKMFKEINNMILTAIQGNFIDSEEFDLELLENENQILARLKPMDSQVANMLKTIEIYFNKADTDINQVVFIEPGDDYTNIEFTHKLINTTIEDSEFEIK